MINFIGVIVAALIAIVIGAVWYNPLFPTGKFWIKYTDNADVKKRHGNVDNLEGGTEADKPTGIVLAISFGGTFVATIIMAVVLSYVTYLVGAADGEHGFVKGIFAGFLMWLGFVAPQMFMQDTFNGRPFMLTLGSWANALVTLVLMGAAIGLLS
jgi:hypothetical protein